MKKLILGLLSWACWGQNTGANVVTVIAVPATTITAGATFTSVPLQNIGQTNHVGVVDVTANSTVYPTIAECTCAVQGSVDGTTYTNIGSPSILLFNTGATSTGQFYFFGYGSYPYIRINATMVTGASLTFSITYVGVSIPYNPVVDMLGKYTNLQNIVLSTLVTGTSTPLLLAISGESIFVYGLELMTDNTATNISFQCVLVASPVLTPFILMNLGTVPLFNFQPQLRPLFSCPVGQGLNYKINGTGTPSAFLNLQYRYE